MTRMPRNPAMLRKLIEDGSEGLKRELLDHLPRPWHIIAESGEGYEISPPLLRAVQVALLLGQPLLLTGDPGVGKTRFAAALATRLQVELHQFNVKTTTAGRDLLYSFDDVARFRDATRPSTEIRAGTSNATTPMVLTETPSAKPLSRYVRFNALGLAIMRSAGPQLPVTPAGFLVAEVAGEAHASKATLTLGELFPLVFESSSGSSHSVVLIDELDKAPRDTPNDLLVEIEEMRFEIREIGVSVRAHPDYWPIVIITSNSERSFPDPFLRRCVFHHLEFSEERLPAIVAARVPDVPAASRLVQDAIDRFMTARDQEGLDKKPGTAELNSFVALLIDLGKKVDEPLQLTEAEGRQAAGVLGKTRRDEETMRTLLTAG